jgi:tetratricopeptide (TPR) repeat protein
MKRIATATLLLVLAGGVLIAGPDEDYLAIYNQIQQGEALEQARQFPAAAARYQQALEGLMKLHKEHPSSNAAAVNYRLGYLQEKLKQKEIAPSVVASTNLPPAVTLPGAPATPSQQNTLLQEQIRALTNAVAQLQMQLKDEDARLKEALAVHPASADPAELDKARKQIISLEKERDLLKVTLDQLKAAPPPAPKPSASTEPDKAAQEEIAGLKKMLDETERKLSDTATELNNLKSLPPAQPPVAANLAQLTAERDDLKKQLAAISKELADSEAHATNSPPATPGADAARLKAVEAERDDLKKQLTAMTAAAGSAATGGSVDELAGLRARLAVLEAAPVPYTAEEQAVLKAAPSTPVAAPPAAPSTPVAAPPTAPSTPAAAPPTTPSNPVAAQPAAGGEPSHKAHSSLDLSAGAKAIMRDANLDIMARRYEDAEKKYAQVLQEDESNIFVLCMLGSAQFSDGHPDDCEKTVRRALALEPNDAGNLYLLGVLRYSQEKYDDAFDALSRSAAVNSTNASTQFYLGSVLDQKGLRSEAETALRKALDLDPSYADAHFALAAVYAAEKPPSLALARWHYQRALDLGHDKSDKLEKMLSGGN